MSDLHIKHIDSYLRSRFPQQWEKHTNLQDHNNLSRALAAQALVQQAGITPEEALGCLVDGGGDNGIDAILCDNEQNCLYLVQSKWSGKSNSSLDKGDALKFLKGAKNLLDGGREKFPNMPQEKFSEIQAFISSPRQIELVIAHTGAAGLADEVAGCFIEYLDELNDPTTIGRLEYLSQANLHNAVAEGGVVGPLKIELTLFDWGYIEKPYEAYYGQIAASDLANLYQKHGTKLFAKNIRSYLGSNTNVNKGIRETIDQNAKKFWHLNNGVTALATKVHRALQGGSSRASCNITCDGFSIVNGAQTVGTLGNLPASQKVALEEAKVLIRVINLEGCPENFPSEVTRATNTQNRIDGRNFVALDPLQERLRIDLAIDGIEYQYRQGEIEPSGPTSFGFTAAAISLACANKDVELSTHAKREVSKLWEDIQATPYKGIFNPQLNSVGLWAAVQQQRDIDQIISTLIREKSGRPKNILTHGNRFIAHLAHLQVGPKARATMSLEEYKGKIRNIIEENLPKIDGAVQTLFPVDSYIQSIFKNTSKVRQIKDAILKS